MQASEMINIDREEKSAENSSDDFHFVFQGKTLWRRKDENDYITYNADDMYCEYPECLSLLLRNCNFAYPHKIIYQIEKDACQNQKSSLLDITENRCYCIEHRKKKSDKTKTSYFYY